jgi:hypothetical protein
MAAEKTPEAMNVGTGSDTDSLYVNPSPLHGKRTPKSTVGESKVLTNSPSDSDTSNIQYAGTVWERKLNTDNSPTSAPQTPIEHEAGIASDPFTDTGGRYLGRPLSHRRKSEYYSLGHTHGIVNDDSVVHVIGPDGSPAKFDMKTCDFVDLKDAQSVKTAKFATGRRTSVELQDWTLPFHHLRSVVPSLNKVECTKLIHQINNISLQADVEKEVMDTKVDRLRASHNTFIDKFEAMKKDFVNCDDVLPAVREKKRKKKARAAAPSATADDNPPNSDDEGSINSSNYNGDNAVIEEAKVLTIQRFTQADIKRIGFTQQELDADKASGKIAQVRVIKPGDVKLVAIPPRKSSRNPPPVSALVSADPAPPSPVKDEPFTKHPKHHCLQHGHVYRVLEFQELPSPLKRKARLGIKCEVCGEVVRDKVWQCEVPVCMQEVCGECAARDEERRAEVAVKSWL